MRDSLGGTRMLRCDLPIVVALLVTASQAPEPRLAQHITRIEVSVGDDSCYATPITDSASIAAVVQFINSRIARPDSAPRWNLGGVHAELYSGGRLVAFFGVGLTRRGFEFSRNVHEFQTWTAPISELDQFLRL